MIWRGRHRGSNPFTPYCTSAALHHLAMQYEPRANRLVHRFLCSTTYLARHCCLSRSRRSKKEKWPETPSNLLRIRRIDYKARSAQWASQLPETVFFRIGGALATPLSEGMHLRTIKKRDFPKSSESFLFGKGFLVFPKRKLVVLIRLLYAMDSAGTLEKEGAQRSYRHHLLLTGVATLYMVPRTR